MANRQDAAVGAANALIAIMQRFKDLRRDTTDFVTQYNKQLYGTTWGALPTATQNTDGSLGTANGTPVAGNPIDSRLTNLSGLTKAVSASMLTNAVTFLQRFADFLGNVAVTAADRNQNVDDLVS